MSHDDFEERIAQIVGEYPPADELPAERVWRAIEPDVLMSLRRNVRRVHLPVLPVTWGAWLRAAATLLVATNMGQNLLNVRSTTTEAAASVAAAMSGSALALQSVMTDIYGSTSTPEEGIGKPMQIDNDRPGVYLVSDPWTTAYIPPAPRADSLNGPLKWIGIVLPEAPKIIRGKESKILATWHDVFGS